MVSGEKKKTLELNAISLTLIHKCRHVFIAICILLLMGVSISVCYALLTLIDRNDNRKLQTVHKREVDTNQ